MRSEHEQLRVVRVRVHTSIVRSTAAVRVRYMYAVQHQLACLSWSNQVEVSSERVDQLRSWVSVHKHHISLDVRMKLSSPGGDDNLTKEDVSRKENYRTVLRYYSYQVYTYHTRTIPLPYQELTMP